MQNQNAHNTLFSFIVVPTPIQYITFLPISPTTPDFFSPSSQHTFASLCFNSGQINELYCRQDYSNVRPISTTSIVEPRQAENPSQNYINIQPPHSQNPQAINLSTRTLSYYEEPLPVHERSQESNMEFSSLNKKQKIKSGGSRIKELEEQDKEYVPQVGRRKKEGIKYHQNQNRNIIPNEVNQIFSFIQKYNKSGYLLQKLFLRYPHPPTFTTKRFYLYQSLLKNKLGHYANEKSLKMVTQLYEPKCESWSEQEQRYYNKLCRILIRHFLYEDSIFIILTSKRMKAQKKYDHLRARRTITESVLRILKGR